MGWFCLLPRQPGQEEHRRLCGLSGLQRSRLERNQVVNNPRGWAFFLQYGESSGPTLVNNVSLPVATSAVGRGHCGRPMTVTLIHNTLAGDGTGAASRGKYVSLRLTNTIVASHTGRHQHLPDQLHRGCQLHVILGNFLPGLVGTHPLTGNPAFTDPSAATYHIYPIR